MKIRIFKKYSDKKFRVNVTAEDFSSDELRWFDEQGDPEVDAGGEYTTVEPVTFELAAELVSIKGSLSGSGYTKSFDSRDAEDAQARANAWAAGFKTKIEDAMQALKDADVSDFEGEEVTNITYS